MKYAVNEEGITAMKAMASAIKGAIEEIESKTNSMRSIAEGYSDTIGPHAKSLEGALSDISDSVKQASEPSESVAEKLEEVAEAYDEIISNDRISRRGSFDPERGPEMVGHTANRSGEYAPSTPLSNQKEWDSLRDVPFAGHQ